MMPRYCLAIVVMVAGVGCNQFESGKIVEVTGRVTLEGKPVEGVVVQLEPDQSSVGPGKKVLPTAYGKTDADGRFRAFRTGKNKFGAAVGLNHVRVTVPEGSSAKVHPRYMGDSTFWHEIGPGPTVVDLELVADPTAVRRQASESAAD
jgi:hypothetical protein